MSIFFANAAGGMAAEDERFRTCNKKDYSHTGKHGRASYIRKRFSPGVFLVYCLCCGVIVGFHVLDRPESSLTFFEVLFSLWERPPRLAAFDFCCGCHLSSMTREAWFFQLSQGSPLCPIAEGSLERLRLSQTLFVGDRLHHEKGHKCGKSFSPNLHEHLEDVNLSVGEQSNSKIAYMREKIRDMLLWNAVFYLREMAFDFNRDIDREWD